jgi:hypothetical protein
MSTHPAFQNPLAPRPMTTNILHDEVAALEAERKEGSTACTDNISQYLFDALITSNAEEFSILKTEVEEYRQTHPQWFAATKHSFLGKLLDAIEEAIKFRAETKKEDDDANIREHRP